MSFLFGAGASLLSAASQQLMSYFEYEIERAEVEEEQTRQHQPQHATHLSPPRRISLPSHRLLSSPAPTTPPQSTTLFSSPTHSLLSTSALFAPSSHSHSTSHPTCTCTTQHTTAADYTLTPFTLEFATALSDHPSTFHSFPACCEWSDRFHLSAVQLVHARRLLSECAVFGSLRSVVREECGVSEFEFWRVYFLLLHNVKARERQHRNTRRQSQGEGRRRSARTMEDVQEDKENVQPKACKNGYSAKLHEVEQQYTEKEKIESEIEADAEDDEQRREHEQTIWAEIEQLRLTLASARKQQSTASALTTPSKAIFLVHSRQRPLDLNDSACSDQYASPSPKQQPCGQLFHRLTADEQQSVADMLALAQQHTTQDGAEQLEVSRLVFSPTPSLDGTMSGDEWNGCEDECGSQDSVSELDICGVG